MRFLPTLSLRLVLRKRQSGPDVATASASRYGRFHPFLRGEMLRARLKDVPFFSSMSKKELAAVAQQTDESGARLR